MNPYDYCGRPDDREPRQEGCNGCGAKSETPLQRHVREMIARYVKLSPAIVLGD